MVFSSLIFMFLFLPAFLAVYYMAPYHRRSLIILIGSFMFYAWWRVDFMFLFAAVILFNYLISLKIVEFLGSVAAKRWMQLGIVLNLLTLAFFKYFNFGIDSLNAIFIEAGVGPVEAIKVILPIGVSFYVFHSMSYLIDVARGDAPPPAKFWDFAAFISLFPQQIAGPVLRYKDLADQFTHRTHTMEKFSQGAYRFMCGFAKKVLIADTVADIADRSFALQNPSMADAWIGALAYTVQLYFDFSGYSDMAVGLGLMMGFKFVENFNHPYISRSITEFWRRWHISLSTWFRDYLYIPMGGNRKGSARTYFNLLTTMLLCGLWHGANWTFIVWGAWHGAIMALERFFKKADKADGTPAPVSYLRIAVTTLCTFFLVVLGWVVFRAENLTKAFAMLGAMFTPSNPGISDAMAWQITGASVTALILGLLIAFFTPYYEAVRGKTFKQEQGIVVQAGAIVLFLAALIKLGAHNYSPFLYFQF